MSQNKDFLSLVLNQLLEIENNKIFKDKIASLFDIFPINSRQSLMDIEKKLETLTNIKNKIALERHLGVQWFLVWQKDFSKSDVSYFEKYYPTYSAQQQKKLDIIKAQYKINPKIFIAPDKKISSISLLTAALKQYKKQNLVPLRNYLNSATCLNRAETKKILTVLDKGDCDIESDILINVLRKGDNLWSLFNGNTYRIAEEIILVPPKDYKEARQIIINSHNDWRGVKTNILDLEDFTDNIFDESNPIYALLSIASYAISGYYQNNPGTHKVDSKKYYNALQNIELSFQKGDLPEFEKKVRKLCLKNKIENYKDNVIENIIKFSNESDIKILKTLANLYTIPITDIEFLTTFKNLNQIYIDKKNLQSLLGDPDISSVPNTHNAKKVIKI